MGQRVLGRIAVARGALDDADAFFEEGLQSFAAIEAEFERARSGLELAGLRFSRGDSASARALLADAYRTFTALAVPAYVQRAEALAAERGIPLP